VAGERSNTPDVADDLFEATLRRRSLAPPGRYIAVLTSAAPFRTPRTSGVEVLLKVTEGTHTGRIIRLRIITDGPATVDGLVAANVEILRQWWKKIGVKDHPSQRDGWPGVFRALWLCGEGKRLAFTIGLRGEGGRFVENTLVAVEWDAAGELGIRS
jgi:hypothetical protein